jgi:Fe-S-cluster containining protein
MKSDAKLVQIVNAASADAVRRSGDWLQCRAGCSQCCVGVFAIGQLDAQRLQAGMRALKKSDPARAAAVQRRADQTVKKLFPDFPGDPSTGILNGPTEDPDNDPFDDFANDEPCPVLDPATGTCDLYTARPLTCRIFGAAMRVGDAMGTCELCFQGATEEEVVAAEINMDWTPLETELNAAAENRSGISGSTIIAFAIGRKG